MRGSVTGSPARASPGSSSGLTSANGLRGKDATAGPTLSQQNFTLEPFVDPPDGRGASATAAARRSDRIKCLCEPPLVSVAASASAAAAGAAAAAWRP